MSSNLRQRDYDAFSDKSQLNDVIKYAIQTLKIPFFKLIFGYMKMNKAGKYTFKEYIEFGLYKDDMSPDDKRSYLSNSLHWPIVHKCCDMSYQNLTEDKIKFADKISKTDINIPPTLAVIDKTDRKFPKTIKLSTKIEFKDFVLANKGKEIFAKEIKGISGFGAFLITDSKKDELKLASHGWITYDECYENIIGDTSYILQEKVKNHQFFKDITENLATIRLGSYTLAGDTIIPYAILKIPLNGNIVDHFWRPGNLICGVDVNTGAIVSAKERTPFGAKDSEEYKRLIGQALPEWKKVINIVKKSAKIFPMLKYQSLDIALTPKGPVVIEVNIGGTFEMAQVAYEKGLLTPSFRKFLAENNYEL
jgi:hypothetical protein